MCWLNGNIQIHVSIHFIDENLGFSQDLDNHLIVSNSIESLDEIRSNSKRNGFSLLVFVAECIEFKLNQMDKEAVINIEHRACEERKHNNDCIGVAIQKNLLLSRHAY